MPPSYDEVLARNSLKSIQSTLRDCATRPCDIDGFYGIPPVVLPFSLAVVESLKTHNPDCVIMISGTPGDGVDLKVHQRDGTTHYLYIEEELIDWHECAERSQPIPAFWHRDA